MREKPLIWKDKSLRQYSRTTNIVGVVELQNEFIVDEDIIIEGNYKTSVTALIIDGGKLTLRNKLKIG